MLEHTLGLRVDQLVYAHQRAKSTLHQVEMVDDVSHMIVGVDPHGHLTIRPEEVR